MDAERGVKDDDDDDVMEFSVTPKSGNVANKLFSRVLIDNCKRKVCHCCNI